MVNDKKEKKTEPETAFVWDALFVLFVLLYLCVVLQKQLMFRLLHRPSVR